MSAPVAIDFGTSTCKIVRFQPGSSPFEHLSLETNDPEDLLPSQVRLDPRPPEESGVTKESRFANPSRFILQGQTVVVGSGIFKGYSDFDEYCYPAPKDKFTGHGPIKLGLKGLDFSPPIVRGKSYLPEYMALALMRYMHEYTEMDRDDSVCCLTVPAYFLRSEVDLIQEAAKQAGWSIKGMLAEPCAAALRYSHSDPGFRGKLLVYDFGGGTFDCAVLQVDETRIEVLAKYGNSKIGGEAIRQDLFKKHFRPELDKTENGKTLLELDAWKAAAQVVRDLSSSESVTQVLDLIEYDVAGSRKKKKIGEIELTFTRSEFEAEISPYVDATIETCQETLHRAGLQAADLNAIFMVGGPVRMPIVKRRVQNWLQQAGADARIVMADDPDFAVAEGAALFAAGAMKREIVDVLARSLRIRPPKSTATTVLLKHGSPLPTERHPYEFAITWSGKGKCRLAVVMCEGEENEFTANEPLPLLQVDSSREAGGKARVTISLWCENDMTWKARASSDNPGLGSFTCTWKDASTAGHTTGTVDATPAPRLDCVFCLDMTDSLSGFRSRIAQACLAVEQRVRASECEPRFGIVAFGDGERHAEPLRQFDLTGSPGVLRDRLAHLPSYQGGDSEEDVAAALEAATRMLRGTPDDWDKIVLLITDGGVRAEGELQRVADAMAGLNIRCVLVCPYDEEYVHLLDRTSQRGARRFEVWELDQALATVVPMRVEAAHA